MGKSSCCCGATPTKPCLCMKQDVMSCSAKAPMCPCYKALAEKKGAESFNAETNMWEADYTKGYTDTTQKIEYEDNYGKPKEVIVQGLSGYAGNCPSCSKRINFPIDSSGLYCYDCQVYLRPSKGTGMDKTLQYDAETFNMEGVAETNFDILNIEYMEDGEETFDYPESMLVSVETKKDDHWTHTKDRIRVKIKSYIRRNFGNDVEVIDFLAFPIGSEYALGQEFDAETFDETYRMKGATKSLISDVLRKHGYDDFNELESENLKFLLYDVFIEGMESASYNAETFEAQGKPTWAGYCPFCKKWRTTEWSKIYGGDTVCAKIIPDPHYNSGDEALFVRENFARKGGKWIRPKENICGVVLEKKQSKNADSQDKRGYHAETFEDQLDYVPSYAKIYCSNCKKESPDYHYSCINCGSINVDADLPEHSRNKKGHWISRDNFPELYGAEYHRDSKGRFAEKPILTGSVIGGLALGLMYFMGRK